MYASIIVVPPFENEEMQFVKAQHEALISQTLFYEVQNILNGNKRPVATMIVSKDMLPLRGFLECPDCNRMLTGSASKGRHERYYYYHYTGTTCKCRFKAETVNQYFEDELIKFNLAPGVGELFKMVVMDECRSTNRDDLDERKVISNKIEEQELNLSKARKRLLKEEIDADDFKAIKAESNEELRQLESRLADLPAKSNELKSIEILLDIVTARYSNILQHYKNQAVEEKIIDSMYPQNLCFDGTHHRTAYLSEPLSLIFLINNNLQKKRGEKLSFYNLSPQAVRRGIEPRKLSYPQFI